MSLKTTIEAEIKNAMRAKDQGALRALRAVKAAILIVETSENHEGELTSAEEMSLLTKQVKQRRDSIKQFEDNGRADLALTEKEELVVIERFLPQQLSREEITAKVMSIIAQTGATSIKEMGKVMGMASKEMAGQADNSVVSEVVKSLLT